MFLAPLDVIATNSTLQSLCVEVGNRPRGYFKKQLTVPQGEALLERLWDNYTLREFPVSFGSGFDDDDVEDGDDDDADDEEDDEDDDDDIDIDIDIRDVDEDSDEVDDEEGVYRMLARAQARVQARALARARGVAAGIGLVLKLNGRGRRVLLEGRPRRAEVVELRIAAADHVEVLNRIIRMHPLVCERDHY